MTPPLPDLGPYLDRPFRIGGEQEFNALALELFHLHAQWNPVYRAYLSALGDKHRDVRTVRDIPFLPIGMFRSHDVGLEGLVPELVFTSSGTTGTRTSRHLVAFPEVYERSFMQGFQRVLGPPSEWCILALLPSYLERQGSSLVHMVERLIAHSPDPRSGTYGFRYAELADTLRTLEKEGRRTLLIGVTFALLDMAEQYPMPLRNTVIVETGGMKGRREELVRDALHARLNAAFGPGPIHSEYGMTELLSQAWSTGDGTYHCPPWMKVLIREPNDPFTRPGRGRTGGLDIIDLANITSCPFIGTQDLGRVNDDGGFEVLGRFDHSDLRGCSLMMIDR